MDMKEHVWKNKNLPRPQRRLEDPSRNKLV
jgi:hypothetical protein